eukprot:ANDGO_05567.mRNA.1 Vacuolar membrane-associated protein IML1
MTEKELYAPRSLEFSVTKFSGSDELCCKRNRTVQIDLDISAVLFKDGKKVKNRFAVRNINRLERCNVDSSYCLISFADSSHPYLLKFCSGIDCGVFHDLLSLLRGTPYYPVSKPSPQLHFPIKIPEGQRSMQHVQEFFITTFNCGGHTLPLSFDEWIPQWSAHVYVMSLQNMVDDVQNAKNKLLDWISSKQKGFTVVAALSFGTNALFVFCHNAVSKNISSVATGTLLLKEKESASGAAACSFELFRTSLCFININLPEECGETVARTAMFKRILAEVLPDRPGIAIDPTFLVEDVTHRFDHVFMLGSFNFSNSGRQISVSVSDFLVDPALLDEHFQRSDELASLLSGDEPFFGLQEVCAVTFPPTSPYVPMSGDFAKGRGSPSWSDRILMSQPRKTKAVFPVALLDKRHFSDTLSVGKYLSSVTVNFSSHRPVFATFQLAALVPVVSVADLFFENALACKQQMFIFVNDIEVLEMKPSISDFSHGFVVFSGRVLDCIQRSAELSHASKFSLKGLQIPVLRPSAFSKESLIGEVLRLSVMIRRGRSIESPVEVVGYAEVPLIHLCDSRSGSFIFESDVSLLGERTAVLKGSMSLKHYSSSPGSFTASDDRAAKCENVQLDEIRESQEPTPSAGTDWLSCCLSDLLVLAREAYRAVPVEHRKYRFRVYRDTALGSDIYEFLQNRCGDGSESTGISIGQRFIDEGLLQHVHREHGFEKGYLFYRFSPIVESLEGIPSSDGERMTERDVDIEYLSSMMRDPNTQPPLAIKDRPYHLRVYKRCVTGKEVVDWIVQAFNGSVDRGTAVRIGQCLIDGKLLHHVVDEHQFEDAEYFYRFHADE